MSLSQSVSDEHQFFETLVENLFEIIAVVDARGFITYVSPSVEPILGYAPRDFVRRNIFDMMHDDDQAALRDAFASAERGDGATGALEFRLHHFDGSWRRLCAFGRLPPAEAHIGGIVLNARDVSEERALEAELRQLELDRKAHSALMQVIEAIARAAEARDTYTAGHERRVAQLADAIAQAMGLSESERTGVRVAATLHDIGKLNVPMEILSKPTVLSEKEMSLVQTHAEHGYHILKGIDFPWPVAEMVLQHHERLDGSGYPRGLMGPDTLIGARILAVADAVEAISGHRPYRVGRGVDGALLHVLRDSGTLYDSAVVEACLGVFNDDVPFRFEDA